MPASSILNAHPAALCFAQSPATAASFVPSPGFNTCLSSFDPDSTMPHTLHEAWPDKNASRIMFGRLA
jgi:hypothetical protein